jgi:hypothetical protein
MPIARDLIERSEAVGAFARQLARGEPETFRVGYSPFLDMVAVGSIRSGFQTNAGTPIEFVSAATARQISGLLKSELQAGLQVPFAHEPAITVEVLSREPFLVAFPRGHRFETSRVLALDDIRSEPVIWFSRDLEFLASRPVSCNVCGCWLRPEDHSGCYDDARVHAVCGPGRRDLIRDAVAGSDRI